MTASAQRFNICCPNFARRRRLFAPVYPPSGYAPMATVTDGHVVLILLL